MRCLAYLAVWLAGSIQLALAGEHRLVIAPHIEGLSYCPETANDPAIVSEVVSKVLCASHGFNAAPRIAAALDAIGPAVSPSEHYALGYTLSIPLLGLYVRSGKDWVIDRALVAVTVQTIAQIDRPVVVYASSNHFGTDADPELLQELSSDPHNLMSTQSGPLPPDRYFGATVYAWSLVNQGTRLEKMRHAALRAVLDEVCRLDAASKQRIRAFSVLGETHQMFPNFFSGMNYVRAPQFTDYSEASVQAFREWLQTKFAGQIDALNLAVNGQFKSFAEVSPPSKDIQHEILSGFLQHIDAYADGWLPIFGWAYNLDRKPVQITIYLNGSPIAIRRADMNRMDVVRARPDFGSPNVGWRYDLDYSKLPPGINTLDIFAVVPGEAPARVARREFTIVDRQQSKSAGVPAYSERQEQELRPESRTLAYVDSPAQMIPLFYNPLARIWNEYRNVEVRQRIEEYADQAHQSCLSADQIYSHQMAPRLYTSWNPDLMAVDASLSPNAHYHLGVTLYGGAAYGDPFFDWLAKTPQDGYGVSELHPMTPLTVESMEAMLEHHRLAGARFVAPYFMSILPDRLRAHGDHNKFRIDSSNPDFGSNSFYNAIRAVMR